eukprot:gene50121-67115_t
MALSCYASAKNKDPILKVLQTVVDSSRLETSSFNTRITEIASGTGEHAAYFAENIPSLIIQPTEPQLDMHTSIQAWSSKLIESVLPPIALD